MDISTVILFILVNVILAFIVGVLGNLASPGIHQFWQTNLLSSRQKRIAAIRQQYDLIKQLSDDRQYLILVSLRSLGVVLSLFVLFITLIALYIFTGLTSRTAILVEILGVILFGFMVIYNSLKLLPLMINNAIFFEEYRETAIVKLKKLGGNPEDLDKEETA